jgi:hypothetical protein
MVRATKKTVRLRAILMPMSRTLPARSAYCWSSMAGRPKSLTSRAGGHEEERQQRERRQRQRPGQRRHRDDDHHDADDVAHHPGQRGRERLLGADDVVVEPADQGAGLRAGEEGDRLAQHVGEHLGAQVEDQALTDP